MRSSRRFTAILIRRAIAPVCLALCMISTPSVHSQETRLLRQPSISDRQVAFAYGSDLWVADLDGSNVLRLTSTPAVEADPHFSPDGQWIAFTSNRSGSNSVYVMSVKGGEPTRLTWHPSASNARGWTPDGSRVVYASERESAPTAYNRLWTVPAKGGPSTMATRQWGNDGDFSPDGQRMVIDRVDRWDAEWRAYRGGQNTPLVILDLKDHSETLLPCPSTIDIQPLWLGEKVYFLSDRAGGVSNIWLYDPATKSLAQVTSFKSSDVKWLTGRGNRLAFERDGWIHLMDLPDRSIRRLAITVSGDFPWAATRWENVEKAIQSASLSPTGKRAVMEARGEIFTVPVENGDVRNLTQSSDAADRTPLWSPKGNEIAWFSDATGKGYSLMITPQDGMGKPRNIPIGESKMAWEPAWSPDGKRIAFTDDDVRIRVVDISSGTVTTVDTGGINLERGYMGLTWSHDGEWLAYSRSGDNMFRSIRLWSSKSGKRHTVTDPFADAFSPAWDRDNKHLYFLASTELALASGWANTSSQNARPEYEAYVINLRKSDQSPFKPKSDEEEEKKDVKEAETTAASATGKANDKARDKSDKAEPKPPAEKPKDEGKETIVDFEGIERRIIPLPFPKRNYGFLVAGPSGSVFALERVPNKPSVMHKFNLDSKEPKEFMTGVGSAAVSADGKKMLVSSMGAWKVASTEGASGNDAKPIKTDLRMQLDRSKEWSQMFEEAWRYERDYFYDPNLHGRDWKEVYDRYAPLVPHVRHRSDLNYILDQMNGELSVGHSFVFGGDMPEVEKPTVGLLGADLGAENGRWRIRRIYHTESWNPGLSSPLDRPGMKVATGHYLVGVNGRELKADEDPYRMLDGTADVQTVLHLNAKPAFEGSWTETVKPLRSENNLRQRAWVEDNRRMVDSLSDGRLGYVWVPNTGGGGFVSFNRYFFAQQDKEGAVIDERFNGGGLLDDYMVDLMTRSLRASLTNEVPGGKPMRLPAGILGPKVLLINEMAGSGGDFFPWAFRHQKAGPLVGARTWGGLVKSSVHYPLVDGGALTAPDNAVFDPAKRQWIAENAGVTPDIEVRQDAKSLELGGDPQLERGVRELLDALKKQPKQEIKPPVFPTPAKGG